MLLYMYTCMYICRYSYTKNNVPRILTLEPDQSTTVGISSYTDHTGRVTCVWFEGLGTQSELEEVAHIIHYSHHYF